MLITFLILHSLIGLIVLIVSVFGGVMIGNSGREALRREIASLRERLAAAESRYQESRRITGELLEVVKEKVRLKSPPWSGGKADIVDSSSFVPLNFESVKPTYQPAKVRFCDSCNVSVRSETWPVKCPNEKCSAWIGDEWPGEIKL